MPPDLEADLARAASTGEHAWREARDRNDYALLLPHLRRNVELRRRYVDCFPEVDDPYDVLLDDFEPGMKTAEMERLLGELKDALLPLTGAVLERSRTVDDSFLYDGFDVARQRQVVLAIMKRMPIAPGTWRLDDTAHPFATAFSPTDVRITTRYSEGNLSTVVVLRAARDGARPVRERRERRHDAHAAVPPGVARDARVAEPHVGEPGRAQPCVLALLLPEWLPPRSPTSCEASARTTSTAP